ncbi:MAG: HAMP domain-containing histidine kinase [Clostridium sp.]|nr:HAMP domain-containing histidine kinase [Clostridium sp.]
MNISLVLIILLIFVCIFLIVKVFLLKKTIREIEKSFTYILESDTNNIVTISSLDKDIKNLTINLNKNLIELRKQKLQYKNGNQELKKIITNISHDLRTPLTVINGYIDLLQKENKNVEQERYIETIKEKIYELKELTEQLFEFSKTVDVNLELKKEQCCINDILVESLANYYNQFKEKNIIPKITISNKKINKCLNRSAIIRIFENILSNVLKYSNGNFEVILNDEGIITFSNKAKALDGITVQKIFDRYFTVENAKESTGIGLAIAKQLTELNGGKITAEYVNEYLNIKLYF